MFPSFLWRHNATSKLRSILFWNSIDECDYRWRSWKFVNWLKKSTLCVLYLYYNLYSTLTNSQGNLLMICEIYLPAWLQYSTDIWAKLVSNLRLLKLEIEKYKKENLKCCHPLSGTSLEPSLGRQFIWVSIPGNVCNWKDHDECSGCCSRLVMSPEEMLWWDVI